MARVVPGGGAQVGVQMMPGCPGPSGSAKCNEQAAPTSGLCHIDDARFADPLHLVNSSGDYTGVPLGGVGVGFFDYAPDGEIKRVAINNAHQVRRHSKPLLARHTSRATLSGVDVGPRTVC